MIITLNCIKPVKITVNKKQCTLLIQTIKYIYMFNYVQIHKYLKNVRYSLMGLGGLLRGLLCYYGKCDFSNWCLCLERFCILIKIAFSLEKINGIFTFQYPFAVLYF